MPTLFDFSQNIKGFVREEKFEEALQYYKDHSSEFSKDEISRNEYIISDIIKSLKKVKKFNEARKYLKQMGIIISQGTSNRILESYGWLLYDELKAQSPDEGEITDDFDIIADIEGDEFDDASFEIEQGDHLLVEIKDLLPLLNPISQYSPFSKLFSATLKKEKKKQKPNWSYINDLMATISIENLSTECESFEKEIKSRKRTIELASDKEQWYAYRSKALLKLGKYQECYDLSQKALEQFDKFHYNNDVWFARRIALCKKELGDVDSAINELLIILKRKNEWFIQSELANLYFGKGNYQEAIKYCSMAALNYGDTEYKIGLFLLFANVLLAQNQLEKAYEHFLLTKLLREEHEWKIKQDLIDALNKTKNDYKLQFGSSQDLLKHLQQYWKSNLPEDAKVDQNKDKNLTGNVKTIPAGKNFGFILGDNNQEYHFYTDQLRNESHKFDKGTKVIFDSRPAREDGKKPSAINIRLKG